MTHEHCSGKTKRCKSDQSLKCCRNCSHLLESPRNNRYGDIDYICTINWYYLSRVDGDITKFKRYSPGGKELECRWERKMVKGEGEAAVRECAESGELIGEEALR